MALNSYATEHGQCLPDRPVNCAQLNLLFRYTVTFLNDRSDCSLGGKKKSEGSIHFSVQPTSLQTFSPFIKPGNSSFKNGRTMTAHIEWGMLRTSGHASTRQSFKTHLPSSCQKGHFLCMFTCTSDIFRSTPAMTSVVDSYPEKSEEGSSDEWGDERVNMISIEQIHSFHITATLVHSTSQLFKTATSIPVKTINTNFIPHKSTGPVSGLKTACLPGQRTGECPALAASNEGQEKYAQLPLPQRLGDSSQGSQLTELTS